MAFYIPTRKLDDWRKLLASPRKQWKPGRSAKLCAETWSTANGFPNEVREALNDSKIELFMDLEFLMGFPEFQVNLPPSGHASQNDIWIMARSTKINELVSITVECKVDESFGKPVREWLGKKPSGKPKRLEYICKRLGINSDEAQDIRYQLLHRTVSSLEMSDKLCCRNALMMVNSFSEDDAGFDDYSKFCDLLGCKAEINRIVKTTRQSGRNLFLGWVKIECVPSK